MPGYRPRSQPHRAPYLPPLRLADHVASGLKSSYHSSYPCPCPRPTVDGEPGRRVRPRFWTTIGRGRVKRPVLASQELPSTGPLPRSFLTCSSMPRLAEKASTEEGGRAGASVCSCNANAEQKIYICLRSRSARTHLLVSFIDTVSLSRRFFRACFCFPSAVHFCLSFRRCRYDIHTPFVLYQLSSSLHVPCQRDPTRDAPLPTIAVTIWIIFDRSPSLTREDTA